MWKCKFGMGVQCRWRFAARAWSRWTNDLRGQHGPWTNTADLGHRSGNRKDPDKTSLAAALYRFACMRTDVLYKGRSCITQRRYGVINSCISLNQSHHISLMFSARYFRVFRNAFKVPATFFTLIFIIIFFVRRLIVIFLCIIQWMS